MCFSRSLSEGRQRRARASNPEKLSLRSGGNGEREGGQKREEGRGVFFVPREPERESFERGMHFFLITASLCEIEKTTREGGSNAVKERRRRDEGDVKTL